MRDRIERPAGVHPSLLALLQAAGWGVWLFMFARYAVFDPFLRAGAYGVDFSKHHVAALAILEGRSPFIGEHYLGFNYPQFTAWLFLFLAWLPLDRAQTVWNVLQSAFVLLTLPVVILYLRPRTTPSNQPLVHSTLDPALRQWASDRWPALAALALGLYAPIYLDMRAGNVQPLNLILIVGLCAAMTRGAQRTAGALLAALSLVKILPVFLAAVFLAASRRRVVATWALALALYGAVLLVTGWWRWEYFLFTDVLPKVGYHWIGISSSLAVIAGTYCYPAILESQPAFNLAARSIVGAVLLGHGLIMAAGWRVFRHSWRRGIAFASLAIVLVSPLVEYGHLTFCIPAWLFLMIDYFEGRIGHRYFLAALSLWLAIFACRYWQELGPTAPIAPLHAATLLLAALWLLTGAHAILQARAIRRRDATREPPDL